MKRAQFAYPVKYFSTHTKNLKKFQNKEIRGIFIPVPTPFKSDGQQSINFDKLKDNFKKWETIPLTGYCVGGTNGEWPLLNTEERIQMFREVKSIIKPEKLLIAGTTCESTLETCKLNEKAADAGADAVLVMIPFYFKQKMTAEAIEDHYLIVAETSPLPVIIYNNPAVTGIDISLEVIEKLAEHRNICGIKDSDMGKLCAIVERTKEQHFSVLAGSAAYLLPALLVGCSGGINGLAAILGRPICDMYSLAKSGKWEEAVSLQKRLVNLDMLILRELGPAALKAGMEILGYYGGECRKPIPPISKENKERIFKALEKSNFL